MWHEFKPDKELRRGKPCSHYGCLQHVSHPCEGCGRIQGGLKIVVNVDDYEKLIRACGIGYRIIELFAPEQITALREMHAAIGNKLEKMMEERVMNDE